MKDHTILVVVCINNEELFEQCERQIRNLFVPPGYVVQIFPIRDAKSMASAYNRALSYPAKYKVYIHQDTFLINREMFYTLISLLKITKTWFNWSSWCSVFTEQWDMVGREKFSRESD